jgi:pyruvate dehydrogenase E2 component (dihydrolipoamide acetyltransferase)
MADVTMPRLSDSMEEGTILKWLKSDGDSVSRGEELVEIETDKANMTYEADQDGTLAIVAQEGDTLPVGETIARIGEGAAKQEEPSRGDAPDEAEAEAPAEPEAEAPAEPEAEAPAEPEAEAPAPTPEREDEGEAAAATNGHEMGRVKASPIARRMARDAGLDLGELQGSGPGGRIVKADVEAVATGGDGEAPEPQAAPEPEPEPQPQAEPEPQREEAKPERTVPAPVASKQSQESGRGEVETQDLTRLQQTIARRMAESKATVPDFVVRTEVDMEACAALRAQLKAIAEPGPSFNDMVVKACALALREFPRANGSYRDGRFELHGRVNVGVAVAAPDALVVPTVFDADRKSLRDIARDTRALAERVRAGSVTPPELSGGTFTVSNLGMFGVTEFTAVINPPQAAILAVGALAPRPVVRDGELVARNTMNVTLACDHRILYGADAAQFLARIRALLEQPLALAF